jgi:tRNA nucleotidyltransferase (CCA-adding enzyme)
MKFLYINEVGIMDIIMPEFVDALNTKQCHEYHCYDVGMHTIHAVDSIEKDFILRWTMLFHDLGKVKTLKIKNGITHFYDHSIKSVEIADSIMKRFRFDNKSINKIKKFVKYHEERPELTEYGIRVLASKVGKDDFENFIKVQKADGMAKSDMKKEEVMFYEIEVKNIFEKIVREGHCIDRKQLAINGKDLQTLGVKQGKEIGKLLELLFEEVLKYPEINKTEILKGKVKEMLND